MGMTKQLRYLLLTGLLVFAGMVLLILVGLRISLNDLRLQEEQKNLAVSRALTYAYGPEIRSLLTGGLTDWGHFKAALQDQLQTTSSLKINVFNQAGMTVYSTEEAAIGEDESTNLGLQEAMTGLVASEYEAFEVTQQGRSEVLRVAAVYLPVYANELSGAARTGNILGVLEVYSDVTPQIRALYLTHLALASAATVMLALVFGGIYVIMRRQGRVFQKNQEQLERYALLVQQTPTILMEVNKEGEFLFLNPSAKKHFPELLGLESVMVALASRHPLLAAWESITSNLQANTTFERELTIAERVYLQKTTYNEQSRNFDMYLYDITQQKRSEAELLRAQREQRAILDAIPDMIFVSDKDGTFLDYKIDSKHSINESAVGLNVTALSFMTPQLATQYKAVADKTLATQKPQYLEHDLGEGILKRSFEARMIPFSSDKVMTLVRDISERKAQERALRESDAKTRSLLAALPELVFVIRKDGVMLEANLNEEHPSLEPMIGRNISDISFIPEEIATGIKRCALAALETGEMQTLEYPLLSADGMREYEAQFVALDSERILYVVRDITARKSQEQALRESEAKNRSLISAFPDLIFVVDKQGKFLEAQLDEEHPLMEPLVGRTFDDISFIPTDVAEALKAKISAALETRTVQSTEYSLPSVGGVNDYEARFVALDSERVLYIARDVSERKQRELALQASEAQVRSLLEAIPDMVFVMGRDGTYLDFKLDKTHGLIEDLVGRNVRELAFIPPGVAESIAAKLEQASKTDQTQTLEYSMDGNIANERRLAHYEARFTKIDQHKVLMFVRDVTKRYENEWALQASEAQVRSLLEAIPDMVFVMGHDGTYLDFKLDKSHKVLEELVGRNVRDLSFMSPEVATGLVEKLDLASRSQEVQSLEYSLDGFFGDTLRLTHYEARFAPVNREKILMVVRDVTQRFEDEIALQNLTREAQRRAQELLLLDRVRTVATQELGQAQVIHKTVDVIAETFDYTMVSIYLLGGNDLVMQHQVGYQTFIERLPLDKGVMGKVARTGQAILLKHVEDDPNFVGAFEGINSEICVPLMDSGKVVGVLNLESTEGRFFDEADFRLMNALSETLGVAFERARLYQETKQSETELRELYGVSQAQSQELARQTDELELLEHIRTLISNKTELNTLFKTVDEVIVQFLGYELVGISLVQNGNLVTQHQLGYSQAVPDISAHLGVGGRVIRNRRAELVADVTQDPEHFAVEPNTRSEVCVPLFQKEKVVGVLIVESLEQTLSKKDLHILDKLGAYVSLAMEQAQLYEEAKASEQTFRELYALSNQQAQSLARRADELALLDNVRTATMNAPSLEALYRTIVEAVVQHLGYKKAFLFEVKDDLFVLAHQIGYEVELNTLPVTQGICGRAYRTAKPLLVTNIATDPDHIYLQKDVVSGVYVPFLQGQEVRGVLAIETTDKDSFSLSEEDLSLLSSLADFISIAMGRAQLYQDLQQSEVRYRELIENATDIIYRIDLAGIFTYSNSVVKRLMDYDEEEIIGMRYLDLVRPDERENVQAFYIQQLKTNAPTSYLEFPAIAKDGREVWIGQSVGLVKDEGRIIGLQAVARDITERKRMEEALVQQAEELSSANADLEQFAFIAAHDLQEPLRKIQAFGDRLNLKYKHVLDDTGRDYLERMRGSATRMRTLIDDLLSFARANKQQKREIASLEPIIKGVLGDLQVRIEETEATISVGTMPTLELDPSQMRQVFQNLIGNALKFRRPEVAPVITVYSHRLPTGEWQIRVSDNGIGFDEQYKDRIFAVFQRLHNRDQYEGTGIGLAIVRRIIESHGGNIEVSSRLHEGTTFYVTLPGVAKIVTEETPGAVLA